MADIEARVHKLERTFDRIVGGAVVLAISMLGLFGLTHLHQIPRAANEAATKAVNRHISPEFKRKLQEFESEARQAAKSAKLYANNAQIEYKRLNRLGMLRTESGVIQFSAVNNELFGERGRKNQRMKFEKEFSKAPKVIVALTLLDSDKGNNLRVRAVVRKIDKAGFNYDLVTWADTKIYHAKASWIAYGY